MKQEKSYNEKIVWFIVASSGLGPLFFGFAAGAFNPNQSYLQNYVFPDIPKNVVNLGASFYVLGGGIGAGISGYLSSKLGRRKTLILHDIIGLLSTLLSVSTNILYMLVGRIGIGISAGLSTTVGPTYVNEMCPTEIQGKAGSAFNIFITTGIFLGFLFGLGTPSSPPVDGGLEWWKITFLTPAIFIIARLYIFFKYLIYDTPLYSMKTGNQVECRRVLSEIYVNPEVEYAKLEEDVKKMSSQGEKSGGLQELLSPAKRKGFIYGIIVALFFTGCGVNLIVLFSTYIFQIGIEDPSDRTPQIFTFLVGFINMGAAYITGLIIEKYGRKLLLLGGNVIVTVILGLITLSAAVSSLGYLLKYLTLVYMFFYSITIGAVVFVYLSDILDEQGIGFAMLCSWGATFLSTSTFPSMVDTMGLSASFFLYFLWSIGNTWFTSERLKETKGMSKAESLNLYREFDESEQPLLVELDGIQTHK